MRTWQKIIIGIMGVITFVVTAVTAYGIKAYYDTSRTFNTIVEKVDRKTTKRQTVVNIDAQEPFSIMLLGIDTGAMGRTEQGRSDTMMVVTVNPQKKQSTIVSLDRDIYTKIVGHDTMDKLNHAYAFGGVEMAMDSVENLLDIPIDHYVTINMQGLSDLIDAVGGIDVHNKYHFELDGVELQADTDYHLDGTKGLSYARYRKYDETTGMGDPDGDIGRQKRQREVIEKIVKKVLSLDSVTNYQKILKAVEKNTKTDLVWADMLDIANHYRNALSKIKQLQLQGEGDMYNGIYYQFLGMDSLLDVQNTLKEQLGIQPSETLPQQDQYTDGYADYRFYNDSDSETDPSVTEGETLQANGGDTSGYTETDDYEEGTASQDAGYTEDAGYEDDAGYTEDAGYTGDAGYAEDPGYTDDNGSDNAVETDPAAGYYDDTNAGYEEDYTETY